jgi:isopentenyl diphosphate isomerase/L-lactate dehydrogenase-like FMN-dependent dehydrogenase
MPYADVSAALEQAVVTWDDLRWIRDLWNGPIIVKGVLTAEDARRAVGAGAEALVVSNHGARQLDGVSSTLRALPEIVGAVGGRIQILLDGGVRRGTDVVKALCLGARAVMVGRAYAYGLGAAGGPGVTKAIEFLRTDILRTLKLLGCEAVTFPRTGQSRLEQNPQHYRTVRKLGRVRERTLHKERTRQSAVGPGRRVVQVPVSIGYLTTMDVNGAT